MKTKLSHSAISKYLECGVKYRYHYKERLRSKTISGALLIGSAIDKAINNLLQTKNLESAIKIFDQEWEYGFINDKRIHLPESELIVYAKKDFDLELLTKKDIEFLSTKCMDINPEALYIDILSQKEEKGFENLTDPNKVFYNLVNWLCLKRKAYIMLKAYNEKVLPKIKNVIDVQKKVTLTGKTGDDIEMYIDCILEFYDGKKYVIDNKTSAIDYDQDEAGKSQQLILYHYACNKEGMNLDGVGFIVMYKNIQKNRIKICEKCGHDGTGGRFKTCDKEIIIGQRQGENCNENILQRCNGDWKETISPECKIDIILNQVTLPAQNLIIQSFKEANAGIKAGIFPPNVDSCFKFGNKCAYYEKCWSGKDDDLIKLEDKK